LLFARNLGHPGSPGQNAPRNATVCCEFVRVCNLVCEDLRRSYLRLLEPRDRFASMFGMKEGGTKRNPHADPTQSELRNNMGRIASIDTNS